MALMFGEGTMLPRVGDGLQLALRRRLTELTGLALLAFAAALWLALASYHPADPNAFSASSAPPRNWLGYPGAVAAETMLRFLGLGAGVVAAFPAAWGLRFLLHRGEERIWARSLLLPVAAVLAAFFAACHPVWPAWPQPVGLGGLIGDAGLGAMLGALPLPAGTALTVATLALGAATLVCAGASLGVTGAEARAAAAWMIRSSWAAGGMVLGLIPAIAGLGARRARTDDGPEPLPQEALRIDPVAPRRADAADAADDDGAAAPRRDVATVFGGVLGRIARSPVRADDEPAPDAMPPAAPIEDEEADAADPGSALGTAIRALRTGGRPAALDRPAPDLDTAEIPAPPRPIRATVGPEGHDPEEDADDETLRPEPPVRTPRAAPEAAPAYDAPATGLLEAPAVLKEPEISAELLENNARQLETVLADYGVRGEIVAVKAGPVVTLYELEPAPGLKASRVIGLADDIARSMSALSARVSTVPGRTVIGIELPNERREKVLLREVLESPDYRDSRHALALALGKTIEGAPCIANLARMPHLLIAGTTGSGKSVAINTMILSLLYRLSPEQCRLIMIDPKMLELSVYDGIPHLLAPVVTDPKKALVALKWVVAEMEDRYRKMSKLGVRNIDGYNARVREALARGEAFERTVQTGFDETTGEPTFETETLEPEAMPMIVVIVDEMADLMMVAGKEIEACIQRLAQMARASGIHLIMATQRPSVDVITGTIKANFPTRISFQVTSKIDSRTILGEQGAEQLLGMGDMLYMAGGGRIRRLHGPFVSDDEVEDVVSHLKTLGTPDYVHAVTDGGDDETQALVDEKLGLGAPGDSDDTLYDKAVAIVARDRKCSTSYIQRKLQIGYNKAARLVEEMEQQGVVTPANAVGKREILIEER